MIKNKSVHIDYVTIGARKVFIVKTMKKQIFSNMFLRMLEFKEWQKKNKTLLNQNEYEKYHAVIAKESYENLFYGLYVPSPLLKEFHKKYRDAFNSDEKMLFNVIAEQVPRAKDGESFKGEVHLIIVNGALCKKDNYEVKHVLQHELSHLFYRYSAEYKSFVDAAFECLEGSMKHFLIEDFSQQRQVQISSGIEDVANEWGAQAVSVNFNEGKDIPIPIEELQKLFCKMLSTIKSQILE